jgi:hypothetical protein
MLGNVPFLLTTILEAAKAVYMPCWKQLKAAEDGDFCGLKFPLKYHEITLWSHVLSCFSGGRSILLFFLFFFFWGKRR